MMMGAPGMGMAFGPSEDNDMYDRSFTIVFVVSNLGLVMIKD